MDGSEIMMFSLVFFIPLSLSSLYCRLEVIVFLSVKAMEMVV
jgi:hypothetical protein